MPVRRKNGYNEKQNWKTGKNTQKNEGVQKKYKMGNVK
jgi:hypothetical protein